jgi:hypothetical protein
MELRIRRLFVLACSLLLVGAVAGPSQALPMINGGISFGGTWKPRNNANAQVAIGSATKVDSIFTLVTSGTGDFSSVAPGTIATYNDFTFNPSTATPGLWSVGGFSFDLATSIIMSQDNAGLVLNGSGTVFGTGFAPTAGTWSWSGDQTGQTFAFSSTTSTQAAIPEPATLSLLAFGLAGFGLNRHLRKAK